MQHRHEDKIFIGELHSLKDFILMSHWISDTSQTKSTRQITHPNYIPISDAISIYCITNLEHSKRPLFQKTKTMGKYLSPIGLVNI